MSSFKKKLVEFLNSAVKQNAVEKPTADSLVAFANSELYKEKNLMTLSGTMSGLASVIICFGIILVIASNWFLFSDFIKISGFIILIGGSHFVGLYLKAKGFEKTAASMHFLGAGLFIAGVGLMAQMFNLYSPKGESFLIWSLMIVPFAFLLRSGAISFLALVAFVIWGNVYMDYLITGGGKLNIVIFNFYIFIATLLGGFLLRGENNNRMASFFLIPGITGVIIALYSLGFMHRTGVLKEAYSFGALIAFIPFAFILILGTYLWFAAKSERYKHHFLIVIGGATLVVTLAMILVNVGIDANSYFEYSNFSRLRKIYYFPFVISVSAWIVYFALAFYGIVYGSFYRQHWMLNLGVILIGLGVLTRFIDLLSTLLDAGILFILSGLMLLAIGFYLERWRRSLIKNSSLLQDGVQ